MEPRIAEPQNGQQTEGLTLEKAKQLFSTEAMKGPSEFALIRDYYHPEVRFRDAVQELRGREPFIEMTKRFTQRCKELDITLHDAAQNGNVIFLQWTMRLRFGAGPLTTIEGTSKLTLDGQGKVTEHRDYFDLWGDALDAIPGVGTAYRKVIKKLV